MSPHNPQAAYQAALGGTSQPAPDTQTLIGLLGSLMPLLLQVQSQSYQPFAQPNLQSSPQQNPWEVGAYQPGPARSLSVPFGGDQFGSSSLGTNHASEPLLDHQAAVNLVEDITADSLRLLSSYLETYAGQHQGLESCVPIITQAARCFAARDYAQAFGLIWQTYRVITALRSGNPQLPPPRAAGFTGTQSAGTIVH